PAGGSGTAPRAPWRRRPCSMIAALPCRHDAPRGSTQRQPTRVPTPPRARGRHANFFLNPVRLFLTTRPHVAELPRAASPNTPRGAGLQPTAGAQHGMELFSVWPDGERERLAPAPRDRLEA